MPAIPVRLGLPAGHLDDAAQVLALAFHHDPIACYVLPDATRRHRVLRWMFQTHLRYGERYGVITTTTAVDGVAIWLPPGQTTPTLRRLVRTGALPAPLKFGWRAFRRSMVLMAFTTAWHHHYAPMPHWYLYYVGVTPSQQGHGIGSALLASLLARADAEALPCYLETGVARNVGFYERHGFQVVAEGALPREGPRLWAMLRAPREG
jgi:ribosomal protein S18 acetylase RimI-like enzyme